MSALTGIPELRDLAREELPDLAYRYIMSAASSGSAAAGNDAAFAALTLSPRVGVDVSDLDTSVELLNSRLPHPILLGPTGCHRLAHPEGELATARGASTSEATYVVSSYTTTPLADIAAACTGRWWHQLNPAPYTRYMRDVLAEAVGLGAEAIVITMDNPVAGIRSAQGWDGVTLPDGLEFGVLGRLPGALDNPSDPLDIYRPALDASWSWDDVAALCDEQPVPVLVKGVLRADDAERAVAAGVSGIIVSNHGGRNLDPVPATAAALPGVASRVAGRVPVLVDGGIRHGEHIVKAIALGADAVLIGRPYLWGLAVDGAAGVQHVVERLWTELRMTMALCGLTSIVDISSDVLWDAVG
ncbi:alpha-hydroxy acid oxidase [Flexivirga caeni]|uniref:Alpha-hydroxy-acid oxidizing protein n=1 Tax=Flexivirga caeni TaxID=2294115 RepID=A0A3M9MFD6_9MICO|nr:alpha-hydroxy acid oxidase [Flexivirga caeni]RNI24262.1 alpha-hydroxy-acid oxidizing protein [Flexivirga caeni]